MSVEPQPDTHRCTTDPIADARRRLAAYDPRPRQAAAAALIDQLINQGYDRTAAREILATAVLEISGRQLNPARYALTVEANRRAGWGFGEAFAEAADNAEAARDTAERFAALGKATTVSTITRNLAMRAAIADHFAEQEHDQAAGS